MPIILKRPDGSVTPYKNAEYIPAYLFLPAAILDRCPQELQLPRTVASYFHDWNVISTVESDLFIELIMDGFAHLVWPYLGVSGYMENYSGNDPVYIIAHSPAFWRCSSVARGRSGCDGIRSSDPRAGCPSAARCRH